jgi:hypothetical protein
MQREEPKTAVVEYYFIRLVNLACPSGQASNRDVAHDVHDKSGMSESPGVHSRKRPKPIARCINASALPYGCVS